SASVFRRTPNKPNASRECIPAHPSGNEWILIGNQIHAHDTNELQAILTQPAEAEVCLLSDSPYRILRAAEAGNLEEFIRLYESDNNRLTVKDSKGRTAAHQAAARNRVNILTFIHGQGGNLNAQDMIGNTPLHTAVENDSFDALEFLLKM
uniref:Uncharacterized protein n=1 Tax=Anopheles atroparvus TaxID=41427 RepID=A0A182J3R1_ANOAO